MVDTKSELPVGGESGVLPLHPPIPREVHPHAIWEWSPNGENGSGVPASQMFDPADGWDLIGG